MQEKKLVYSVRKIAEKLIFFCIPVDENTLIVHNTYTLHCLICPMDLESKHYHIIEKIRQAYSEKVKIGYTDPDEVKLIDEMIEERLLNRDSFTFSSEGKWVYQNGFYMPFTREGLKRIK